MRGSFRTYWEQYGGLAQFGYPITEAIFEPRSATAAHRASVQYFQRARFELHPETTGTPYAVLLGRLGAAFHPPDAAVAAQAGPSTHYFPATGHNVESLFYRYWQTHGSVFVHGYPISEALREVSPLDGTTYTVQYFERSRFEWHPESADTSAGVLLGLLGTQLAQQKDYFPRPPYNGTTAGCP